MTETVLKFLYDNKDSLEYIKINHLFVDKRPIGVRYLIRDLVNAGFISIRDTKHNVLGSGRPLQTIDTIELMAKIKSPGEQYYLNTYMKKNDSQTFNIDQLVNIGGDNNAPISQIKDHSSSRITTKETTNVMSPKNNATKKAFWDNKYVIPTVSGIIVAIFSYLLIKYFN